MCSEICPPRMSFSCDFVVSPLQLQSSSPSPSIMVASAADSPDFEFNACGTFDYQSSTADELFADGKILPTHPPPAIRRLVKPPPPLPPPPPPISNSSGTAAPVTLDQSEVKLSSPSNTKSFWGFKRSMSLNSNNSKKSFFSLPPLLSRSNSTGSVPTQKRTLSKQPSIRIAKSSSLPSSLTSGSWNQKPPLGKKSLSGNGGYRVSPVLNVPSPANLFGFGSLFSNNGKDQKKKIRR